MTTRPKGFVRTLLDVSFSDYVTTRLIRALYRIVIVVTVNGVIFAWLFTSWLPDWFGWGIKDLMYITAPVGAVVWLTIVRILLEYLIVIYQIDEKLATLAHNHNHKEHTK